MDGNFIMSMSKFLLIYYNLEGEVIHKLTHEQLNDILDIEAISNDEIDIEDVVIGDVVLVKDCDGRVKGYNNPLVDMNTVGEERTSKIFIKFDEKNKHDAIDIDSLNNYSDYELEELMKLSKKNKDEKAKYLIIKELHKRKGKINEKKAEKIEKIRKIELRKEW